VYQIGAWINVREYHFIVHEVRLDFVNKSEPSAEVELFEDSGVIVLDEDTQRVFYVNVAYENRNWRKSFSYRLNQWSLFDTDGYTYQPELRYDYLFKKRGLLPLVTGELNPNTRVRGWLAFILEPSAVVERIHFLTGFLSGKAVDILVPRRLSLPPGQQSLLEG
jgi:hypothetical protein